MLQLKSTSLEPVRFPSGMLTTWILKVIAAIFSSKYNSGFTFKEYFKMYNFFSYYDRHEIMYPLQFTQLLGLVDVECIIDAGGPKGQAGAIRYALAMCLRSFVDQEVIEEMKVCGLLTQDVRVRERKKFGQKGARAKFPWKRR